MDKRKEELDSHYVQNSQKTMHDVHFGNQFGLELKNQNLTTNLNGNKILTVNKLNFDSDSEDQYHPFPKNISEFKILPKFETVHKSDQLKSKIIQIKLKRNQAILRASRRGSIIQKEIQTSGKKTNSNSTSDEGYGINGSAEKQNKKRDNSAESDSDSQDLILQGLMKNNLKHIMKKEFKKVFMRHNQESYERKDEPEEILPCYKFEPIDHSFKMRQKVNQHHFAKVRNFSKIKNLQRQKIDKTQEKNQNNNQAEQNLMRTYQLPENDRIKMMITSERAFGQLNGRPWSQDSDQKRVQDYLNDLQIYESKYFSRLSYYGSCGEELYLYPITKGVKYQNDQGLVLEGDISDDNQDNYDNQTLSKNLRTLESSYNQESFSPQTTKIIRRATGSVSIPNINLNDTLQKPSRKLQMSRLELKQRQQLENQQKYLASKTIENDQVKALDSIYSLEKRNQMWSDLDIDKQLSDDKQFTKNTAYRFSKNTFKTGSMVSQQPYHISPEKLLSKQTDYPQNLKTYLVQQQQLSDNNNNTRHSVHDSHGFTGSSDDILIQTQKLSQNQQTSIQSQTRSSGLSQKIKDHAKIIGQRIKANLDQEEKIIKKVNLANIGISNKPSSNAITPKYCQSDFINVIGINKNSLGSTPSLLENHSSQETQLTLNINKSKDQRQISQNKTPPSNKYTSLGQLKKTSSMNNISKAGQSIKNPGVQHLNLRSNSQEQILDGKLRNQLVVDPNREFLTQSKHHNKQLQGVHKKDHQQQSNNIKIDGDYQHHNMDSDQTNMDSKRASIYKLCKINQNFGFDSSSVSTLANKSGRPPLPKHETNKPNASNKNLEDRNEDKSDQTKQKSYGFQMVQSDQQMDSDRINNYTNKTQYYQTLTADLQKNRIIDSAKQTVPNQINKNFQQSQSIIKPPLNSKQRPMTGQLKIKKVKMHGDTLQGSNQANKAHLSHLDRINLNKCAKLSDIYEGSIAKQNFNERAQNKLNDQQLDKIPVIESQVNQTSKIAQVKSTSDLNSQTQKIISYGGLNESMTSSSLNHNFNKVLQLKSNEIQRDKSTQDQKRSRLNFNQNGPCINLEKPVGLEVEDLQEIMDRKKRNCQFETEYEQKLKEDALRQLIKYKQHYRVTKSYGTLPIITEDSSVIKPFTIKKIPQTYLLTKNSSSSRSNKDSIRLQNTKYTIPRQNN